MFLDKKYGQWLTLFLMSFIWGTSFILMKKGLLALPPDVMAMLRITFAFLFFLPLALKNIKKINRQNIVPLLIVGFIGNFFPAILFATAETQISSALAGMLNATTPIFVWLTGILFYKAKTSKIAIAGIIIGFIGTLGLLTDDPRNFFDSWNFYALLILLATLMYGFNTNNVKYKLHDLDAISISSLGFFLVGPFAIIYLAIKGYPQNFVSHPDFWLSTGSVAALAFFSSFLAIMLFNLFIKHTTAVMAASVTYIIPIFAIFWGVLDGETIPVHQYIFMAITIIGVYLVNKEKYKDEPAEEHAAEEAMEFKTS